MESINAIQPGAQPAREPEKEFDNVNMEEDDAVRKVEEATTPDHSAQKGVRNVEAVTLTWTKTSLACAFVWYVQLTSSLHILRVNKLIRQVASGCCTSPMLSNPPSPPT